MKKEYIEKIPICVFLSTVIIIVFLLITFMNIKSFYCDNKLLESFYSNFIHIEPYHLGSNLFSLYAISRIEKKLGSKNFFFLLLSILSINTIIEYVLKKNFDICCGIGFSGVLFSLFTFELIISKKLDLYLISSIILSVYVPSVNNENISFWGHATGTITGLIIGTLYKKYNIKNINS